MSGVPAESSTPEVLPLSKAVPWPGSWRSPSRSRRGWATGTRASSPGWLPANVAEDGAQATVGAQVTLWSVLALVLDQDRGRVTTG